MRKLLQSCVSSLPSDGLYASRARWKYRYKGYFDLTSHRVDFRIKYMMLSEDFFHGQTKIIVITLQCTLFAFVNGLDVWHVLWIRILRTLLSWVRDRCMKVFKLLRVNRECHWSLYTLNKIVCKARASLPRLST
jgi:hypothetical protein